MFATVYSMRFAGQTNASNSGFGGMPGNSPSLAQVPAEHVVCSVPPTPEFETKFGYCLRKSFTFCKQSLLDLKNLDVLTG